MSEASLSHLDADGKPSMVDVGAKAVTRRSATAIARVRLPAACVAVLAAGGDTAKGNVFEVVRLAGVMGAKRTSDLIPLCHPLPLDVVRIECELAHDVLLIRGEAACSARTGVEMEALTAVSVAALTAYDMLKAVSHDLVIEGVELVSKSGGRSGDITRQVDA